MKKFSLFLSAMLISIMSFAGTVTFDVAVDKTEVSTAAELTLTKDGVSLHVSQGILGNGTNYRVYKNQWIDVSCEYGNITSVEFTCTKEGTAQYGPGCFEYRGSAGTYTYDGFIGTWTGNEEKVTLYAALNQVRATKIVVTYESSDANFVSQPMITGDLNFADTANVVITADEGMKIYYTLDGTDPTTASTEYIAPFQVYATTTVKAIAYNEATAASSMITETVFTQATKVPCAEAAAIAKALSNNTETTELYYNVKGYVTSLKDTFNTSYSTQQFWIADTKTGGEVLYAYNNQVPCAMEVGMKVRIVGKLKQWNTGQSIQPQIVNAQITVLAPAPKLYTVSATAENGTVEGAGQYEEGTPVTLTATAAEGYEFVNWTVDGTEVSTENPYTFNVTADVALVANFQEAAAVTTKEEKSACPAGTLVDGKVIHELESCTIVQEQGTATSALTTKSPWAAPAGSLMTITPKEGVTIQQLVVNIGNTTYATWFNSATLTNATMTKSNNIFTITVTDGTTPVGINFVKASQFKELTVTYTVAGGTEPEPLKYTVTVKAENGTVEGAGEYVENTEATLTATAAEGYEFVNWTVADSVVSTKNPYKFIVTADVEVVANFQAAAPATETVYFINTKKWSAVKAHAWGGKATGTAWPGLATIKETEQIAGFDVYSFTANTGAYKNVIFNNNNGGSQTPDLVWTAGKYYVMDMGWLTKEEAEAKLATPIPDVWTIVGAKGLLGTDWNLNDANNNMTLQADGTYQLVKTDIVLAAGNYDYKAAKDHAWTTSVPQSGNQTLKITTSGTYDVAFVLDVTAKKLTATATLKKEEVIIPTIQVAGDMTSWGDAPVTLVMAADSLTATATIKLEAKTYEFKMIIGGNWQSDAKTIDRDNNAIVFTGANSDTNTKLVADVAGDYLFTWTYETKTLTVTYPKLPAKPEVVTEMVGVVKRAIQNGDNTIVLTHEADGTAHIYELANGTILELVQEGIIPVDTTNLGDYLAISDIALTEDGKLVANNYMRVINSGYTPDAGYLRGENRFYIWNDLAAAPSIWFVSSMTSNSIRSDQGITMAVKGTSTNAQVLTTGVHNSGRGIRMSLFTLIDGAYVDPAVNHNEYYRYISSEFKSDAVYNEAAHGVLPELSASPLGEKNWVMDNIGMAPSEFSEPVEENGGNQIINSVLADDVVGKKFNGATYLTIGEQVIMVAPYANAEGLLAGVKVLDITTGLAAAVEITTADLDAAVAATAAATAVKVVDDENIAITLIADAAVYNLTATLAEPIEYVDITMTNMVATDMGTYTLVEASDDMTAIGVTLGIDAEGKLVEGSTVDWYGTEMPIVSSEVFTKTYSDELASDVYTGKLVIDFMGGLMGLNLTMYTIPVETIEVTIENAEVVVDLDWSELSYAANWTYEEVTYPVSVLLYGYDEEETEFEGMQIAELQIGGDGDDDPWLDYAVAEAVTVTKAGNVITLKGEFSSYATGNIYELTISGEEVKSSVDNIQLHVESVKLIRNHQLIIRKDGREYNAQGATIQ